jgi:hypothetical protein
MSTSEIRIYQVRNRPVPRYFSLLSSGLVISLLISLLYLIGGVDDARAEVTCTSGSFTDTTLAGTTTHVIRIIANSTTTDGSCTFTVPENVYYVDYLVVAGGGGGASGGGGAGGVVTSWTVRNQANSANLANRQSPLTVFPGENLDVRVGVGGAFGGGGSGWDYLNPNNNPHPASNGNDSRLGSVVATGGGAGGFGYGCSGGASNTFCTDSGTVSVVPAGATTYNLGGSSGGSGGGSSYDFVGNSGGAAASSTVVGATTRGNNGGQTGGSGGYRAGAGGGGAGTAGGGAQSSGDGLQHIGGVGGEGIRSDISGSSTTYACGGGGGINENGVENNRNYTVSGSSVSGGGAAGCTGAGTGSSAVVNGTGGTTSRFNGTSGAANFGHGGGGTDPESYVAGSGGSGVVIIRYTIPDALCPNNTNATPPATLPLACPTTISVTAGNTTYRDLDMRGDPYSYSVIANTTPSIIATPTNMDAILSGNLIRIRVLGETNTLISGTYPVIYTLTTGSNVSESYILVNVIDPGQRTPLRIPVDPRATQLTLPSIIVGNASATQICIQNESATVTYPNPLTIGIPEANQGSETRTALARGGLRINGTNSVVQRSTNFINLNAPNGETILTSGRERTISVNVSNTNNGGNGSCSFGTSSTITLVPLELWQNPRQAEVGINQRR